MQTNQFLENYPSNEDSKTGIKEEFKPLKYLVPLSDFEGSKVEKIKNIDEDLDFLIITEYRMSTGGKSVLYELPFANDTSTTVTPETYQMFNEFKDILLNCSMEGTEDDPSPLIIATKEWLEKYGSEAVGVIKIYINSTYPTTYLLSEVLELLGDVNNQASYEERRILLEGTTKSNVPEIRYGAILGLANMNSKKSINILEDLLKTEDIFLILNTLKAAIRQLKE